MAKPDNTQLAKDHLIGESTGASRLHPLRLSVWQILKLPGQAGTPGVTRISPSLIAPASL
jgi:hypothetical protein